jgi:hypothetical protein
MTALVVAGCLLALLSAGNVLGWLSVRRRGLYTEPDPWNWRVLTGPWGYYPWRDRRALR